MAYENVCKQSLLYEGELVPCKVGDQEVVIMWPDGARPRPMKRAARMKASRSVAATSTAAFCIAPRTDGSSTATAANACSQPDGR